MKSKKKYIYSTLLILVTLIVTIWIVKKYRNPMRMPVHQSGADMSMEAMGGQTGYVPVATAIVERGAIDEVVNYSGTIVPYTQQDIYPRVTGRILQMNVYPGDEVKPGELLVKLDTEELSSKVKETELNVEAAQQEYQKAERELDAAKARVASHEHEIETVEADYEYWKNEIEREEKLYKNGAVSKDEYQMELSKYGTAEANLKLHHDMHEESLAMMQAAEFNLNKTKAMLEASKTEQKTSEIVRDYTSILSPIHGYVSERMISPGVLVEPGTPILRLVETDKVRVQANVPTAGLTGIRKGNRITIISSKNENQPVEANITSIFPSADPTARTVVVEAVVENKNHRLLPGDFVSVQITGEHESNALMVPSSAIVRLDSENTTAVWTVEGNTGMGKKSTKQEVYYTCEMHPQIHLDKPGKCPICGMPLIKKTKSIVKSSSGPGIAHLKKVGLGIRDSNNTEILDGLKEGEVVIRAGMQSLQDGDWVYPSQWTKEGPATMPPPPDMKDMPGMSHDTQKQDNHSMDNMPGMKM